MCNIGLSSPIRDIWEPLPLCSYMRLLRHRLPGPGRTWGWAVMLTRRCGYFSLSPWLPSSLPVTSQLTDEIIMCLFSHPNWLINEAQLLMCVFRKSLCSLYRHPLFFHTISIPHLVTKQEKSNLSKGGRETPALLASSVRMFVTPHCWVQPWHFKKTF